MLEPFNRTQPVHYLSLGLSKSLSYMIISLRLCFVVLLINNIKKLVTSFYNLHLFVSVFSLFLPLKNVQHVFLWYLVLLLRSYSATLFLFFILENLKKILENILENTGISCSNLDGHPVKDITSCQLHVKAMN